MGLVLLINSQANDPTRSAKMTPLKCIQRTVSAMKYSISRLRLTGRGSVFRTAMTCLAVIPQLAFALEHEASAYSTCVDSNGHGCWATLSGPNYSQVAVGANGAGPGVACAVLSPQTTSYGGTVHCYKAFGSSGANIELRGGQETGSPYFDAANPAKRIVSLAIETWPAAPGFISVDVLRSDGAIFSAGSQWPRISPNPAITFSQNPGPNPPSPRSIAFVKDIGLIVTDTSNQQWIQLDRDHNYQWQKVADHVVFVAGNQVNGQSIAQYGTTGTSTTIGRFYGTVSPPDLPSGYGFLVGYGSSPVFNFLGRTTPLAIGARDAWAIMTASSSACGGIRPCIIRSTPVSTGWTSWSTFRTDQSDMVPVSIQDGYSMRFVRGEIWVIQQNARLLFWAP